MFRPNNARLRDTITNAGTFLQLKSWKNVPGRFGLERGKKVPHRNRPVAQVYEVEKEAPTACFLDPIWTQSGDSCKHTPLMSISYPSTIH